jgi:hypothetical protein
MSINLEKGVFHCLYCERGGPIKKLLLDYPDLAVTFPFVGGKWTVVEGFPSLQVPDQDFISLMDNRSVVAWTIKSYLTRRGIDEESIKRFNILMSIRLAHRAIFPDPRGPHVFWAARSVLNTEPKWLFPGEGETLISKGEALWGWMPDESDIYITEGVFDAVAVKGVAVFGKKPTNRQLQRIIQHNPRRLFVAFDRDASEAAEDLRKKMKSIVPTGIKYPPRPYKDWGETIQQKYRLILEERIDKGK